MNWLWKTKDQQNLHVSFDLIGLTHEFTCLNIFVCPLNKGYQVNQASKSRNDFEYIKPLLKFDLTFMKSALRILMLE